MVNREPTIKRQCSLRQPAASKAVAARRKRFNALVEEGLRKYDNLWKSLAKK